MYLEHSFRATNGSISLNYLERGEHLIANVDCAGADRFHIDAHLWSAFEEFVRTSSIFLDRQMESGKIKT